MCRSERASVASEQDGAQAGIRLETAVHARQQEEEAVEQQQGNFLVPALGSAWALPHGLLWPLRWCLRASALRTRCLEPLVTFIVRGCERVSVRLHNERSDLHVCYCTFPALGSPWALPHGLLWLLRGGLRASSLRTRCLEPLVMFSVRGCGRVGVRLHDEREMCARLMLHIPSSGITVGTATWAAAAAAVVLACLGASHAVPGAPRNVQGALMRVNGRCGFTTSNFCTSARCVRPLRDHHEHSDASGRNCYGGAWVL